MLRIIKDGYIGNELKCSFCEKLLTYVRPRTKTEIGQELISDEKLTHEFCKENGYPLVINHPSLEGNCKRCPGSNKPGLPI